MKVYINDHEYIANEGETIIELSDRVGIHIPRFCYHKHLSVVASCRMCLIDIEGVNHAQPACSTQLRENMKVSTKTNKTIDAQKSTMEFLLINHPLDCPICDQGGECELQDISLEHGDDHSEYIQMKRVVLDKDISPLISTDMTRCIHCSRCVRFGEEISGTKELGLLDRGEDMKIDVFIEKGVRSELSGNMIDLCPVGALNNKPYRYSARTWDLAQHEVISPHDCLGSNIYYHTYKNKIVRAVPMENPNINQTWISDRDRFGYEGIYSNDRSLKPLIRDNGKLIECDIETAISSVHQTINESIADFGREQIGCMISPQSTTEELFLFKKILKKHNINNLDHRTNECDYGYQEFFPLMPTLGCNLNEINSLDNIVLVGINIKREFPLLSIRLLDAVNNKTKITSLNLQPSHEDFQIYENLLFKPDELVNYLTNKSNENNKANGKTLIILGPEIKYLENQSDIYASAAKYSKSINAKIGFLNPSCNTTSAWLLGLLPHRDSLGKKNETPGLTAYEMIEKRLSSYIFYNLEPEFDFWNNQSLSKSLETSKKNIFFTSFMTPMIEKYADIIIPIATYAESPGSYINIEGTYQNFKQSVQPKKNIYQGWLILNEILKLNTSSELSFESLQKEIKLLISDINFIDKNIFNGLKIGNPQQNENPIKLTKREIYSCDQVVRRSQSLQMTDQAKENDITISSDLEKNLIKNDTLQIKDNDSNIQTKNFSINNKLPDKTILIPYSKYKDIHIGSKSGYMNFKAKQ